MQLKAICKYLCLAVTLLPVSAALFAQEPGLNTITDVNNQLTSIQQFGKDCIKKQQFDQAIAVFKKVSIAIAPPTTLNRPKSSAPRAPKIRRVA